MDFQYFEQITYDEANGYLQNFLSIEEKHADEMLKDASNEGLEIDYSIESLPNILGWLVNKMKTIPTSSDESLPKWIKECDSYLRGLVEFDDTSKIAIIRAAYYTGECFVKSSKKLHWGIGNPETALANMPVVKGFKNDMELAPLLMIENLFMRILCDGADFEQIQTAIQIWESDIP